MRFDDHPGEADRMDKLQQWALPASIAFAGACVLGAGVLVSMPLNALNGIEASLSSVVGEYKTGSYPRRRDAGEKFLRVE